MAIRDRFRRSARKSAGSDEQPLPGAAPPTTLINTGASSLSTSPSSSATPSTTDLTKMATISSSTTISSSSSSSSSSTTTSRRMRLPWLSGSAGGARRDKKKGKNLDSCYGPLNKPFTETNLRHQEMFSTFTMTFGSQRRGSSGAWSYDSGVSPFTSRHCSIDLSAGGPSALV